MMKWNSRMIDVKWCSSIQLIFIFIYIFLMSSRRDNYNCSRSYIKKVKFVIIWQIHNELIHQ